MIILRAIRSIAWYTLCLATSGVIVALAGLVLAVVVGVVSGHGIHW